MAAFTALLVLAAVASAQCFEAASVKPSHGTRASMRGGPGAGDPGQITFTAVTLASVLQRAYDAKRYQVSGPDWVSTKRYDILAKLPPGATKEQFETMLQNLLAERFHLALHHETREIQGYDLAPAKNGPKLKASSEEDSAAPPAPEPTAPPRTDANGFPRLDGPGLVMMEGVKGKAVVVYLTARAQPIAALTDRLSREFRMPIADKTGLSGKFDFTVEFAPHPPGALPPPPSVEPFPRQTSPHRT
jgi:uncharacterized protein (TIGR03435 family)